MKLYPAIDILGGHAVRLVKGDFDAKKVYDEDPLSAATGWVEAGARYLHVVDLDGAKQGTPTNLHHLRRIASELGVPVQFGGGLRSPQAVSDAFEAGVSRVILGTAAFTDPGFLTDTLKRWPGQVLVSVDTRGGKVSTAGWTETLDLTTTDVVERLWSQGATDLVYTNVDRDGMLDGPDLKEVGDITTAVKGSIIYSGGIGALADLEGLVALKAPQLGGVIVGKALYERRFTVAEALAVLDGDMPD
ncbi:MAG: 1-(5-phosphoribosyl)-5-[(5-phosphoribosylamino)methylideneamino]imidazole-4-carboxamide isomerase [Solirubrobacteraceae bacterium]